MRNHMAVFMVGLAIFLSYSPAAGAQVAQSVGPYLFAGTDDGDFSLFSGGDTGWTELNTRQIYISNLAVSGMNLFAATSQGVFLSKDNGTSWTGVNSGLPTDSFSGRPDSVWGLVVSGTNLYVGTQEHGVFLSRDNGTSWSAADSGMPAKALVTCISVSGTDLYAGTAEGGLFLSKNNGSSWAAINPGVMHGAVKSLLLNGTDFYAGTSGGGVFLSPDNGASWKAVSSGLPGTNYGNVIDFAVGGTNLFAVSYAGVPIRSYPAPAAAEAPSILPAASPACSCPLITAPAGVRSGCFWMMFCFFCRAAQISLRALKAAAYSGPETTAGAGLRPNPECQLTLMSKLSQ